MSKVNKIGFVCRIRRLERLKRKILYPKLACRRIYVRDFSQHKANLPDESMAVAFSCLAATNLKQSCTRSCTPFP